MADGNHIDNKKLRYLQNCLDNLEEILNDDAY